MDATDRRLKCALAMVLTGGAACHDGVVARSTSEIAGYTDSFATTVVSPSVAARVDGVTNGFSAGGRYLADVVTTASPDIVSSSSPRWNETRHAGSAFVTYKPGAVGAKVAGSVSYSPDYVSRGASGALLVDDDEKKWTVSIGGGYGRDTIGRTGTPMTVFSRQLDIANLAGSASRVVDDRTWVTVALDLVVERGDPSKPYRYVPMFSPEVAVSLRPGTSLEEVLAKKTLQPLEQLPRQRDRFAITTHIAHRFDRATLRAEERVYADTWGLLASTSDARLYFDAGRINWGPSVRLNVQSATTFYSHAYASTGPTDLPTYRTGDRELGPLVSASLGGRIRYELSADDDATGWAIGLIVDGTFTHFFQTLYVTQRLSSLAALSLEAWF